MIFDPFLMHPATLLLIPPLILTLWAQFKVKSTFQKYAEVGTRRGITGAEVAALILRDTGIGTAGYSRDGVAIEPVPGALTDHYDPRDRTLRLSEPVYGGHSVAALGVAAHEVGHAIQHAQGYAPMQWRSFVYPVANFGSSLGLPLFLAGFLFGQGWLLNFGIALFFFAVLFTLVTLPVEFDASKRAMRALASGGYLTDDELSGARKVLRAAAMTYVASAAMAIAQLLRLLLIASSRRD
jgi:Zn-dependent membrane protease YugP